MTKVAEKRSIIREVLDMYDRWGAQLAIYFTVLTFSTSLALLLDLQFGMPPAWVLFYVSPLTVVLLIAVPAAYVVFCRAIEHSASNRKDASPPLLRSGK